MTWNICRGLYSKETEISEVIRAESAHLVFLQETDIIVDNKKPFTFQDYKAILPHVAKDGKARMLGFYSEDLADVINIREDLMSDDFCSVWVEVKRPHKGNMLVAGYYREWNNDANQGMNASERLTVFLDQLYLAAEEKKKRWS